MAIIINFMYLNKGEKMRLNLVIFASISLIAFIGCKNQSNSEKSNSEASIDASSFAITFKNGESEYLSPVIYLVDNDPFIAEINDLKTTGGLDGNHDLISPFSSINFNLSPNTTNINSLKIEPYFETQSEFCKKLRFNFNHNSITFSKNSEFEKLPTQITCSFKVSSIESQLNENKLDLLFNYTVKGWASELGKDTEAQKTADLLLKKNLKGDETELALTGLGLIDISPLTSFNNLQKLNIFDNQITTIPDSISNLAKLKQLNIYDNKITIIPDSLAKLTNLKEFYLNNNQVKVIPDSLAKLTNLTDLMLQENQIKVIPDSLSDLTNLQKFNLYKNKITEIPDSLAKLTKLEQLYISNNQITEIPDSLSKLINLKILDLRSNQIRVMPDSLSELKSLEKLYLSKNQIVTVSDYLPGLTTLRELYLDSNQINIISEGTYFWMTKILARIVFNKNPGFDTNFGNNVNK